MDNAVRVLIVDDEKDARNKIALFLEGNDAYEIVGEAADGEEALRQVYSLSPDLVFLDIQMPRVDGFTVAANLVDSPEIKVVFVTAYDQYAVGAFELNAVDYLLKPFDRERFENALARVAAGRLDHSGQVPDLIRSYRNQSRYPTKLIFRSESGLELVPVSSIEWVESSGNYVKVCSTEHAFLARQTLASVQSQLPGDAFIRIHRSHLVNISRIARVRSLRKGDHEVEMQSGTILRLSRSFARGFFEQLKKRESSA